MALEVVREHAQQRAARASSLIALRSSSCPGAAAPVRLASVLVSIFSAAPSAPRASSSAVLSAGTTSLSKRLIVVRASFSVSLSVTSAVLTSSPMASSGTRSSLSMMLPSFASSSGSVLVTVGSSGALCVQSTFAGAAFGKYANAT